MVSYPLQYDSPCIVHAPVSGSSHVHPQDGAETAYSYGLRQGSERYRFQDERYKMPDEASFDRSRFPRHGDGYRREEDGVDAKRVGLDISKNLFELHGVNRRGQVVLQRSIPRWQLSATFAQMPSCVIGLEACGTAHEWGKQLASFGHEVRLLSPRVVAPYRGYLESGATTAQLICEALGRDGVPFTRIKATRRKGRWAQAPMHWWLLESLRLPVSR